MAKKVDVNLKGTVRSIEMTDAQAERVETAITQNYGYKEEVEDENGDLVANPQSKDEFVRDRIKSFLENHVDSFNRKEAVENAVADLTPFKL